VSVWLLDVNVLVARFWEPHVFNRKVRTWMSQHEKEGWATCPITQLGLVRTISNPGFASDAPRTAEAIHWLTQTLQHHPDHQFWGDDLSLSVACHQTASRISGFKQLTDAYLIGLALHRNARLLTLDRRMLALTTELSGARKALVVLS
jgi:uncharacterized protein